MEGRLDAEGGQEPEGDEDMDGQVREQTYLSPTLPSGAGAQTPSLLSRCEQGGEGLDFGFLASATLLPLAGPLHRELTCQPPR